MNLVRTFSKMLDSIPHDQAFTQLVINQIVTYYDKCCGWYKGESVSGSATVSILIDSCSSCEPSIASAPRRCASEIRGGIRGVRRDSKRRKTIVGGTSR